MPKLFEKIAESKGKQVRVTQITRGKYTFYLQAKRKKLYQALKSRNWDIIVLQGSSRDMLRDSTHFRHKTYPALDKMLEMIRKNQEHAQVYFYMTWPYREGDRTNRQFSNPDSMLRAVASGYRNLGKRYKIPVIPVGKVWRNYTIAYPEINLYTADNSHPSFEGSYLVACTIYSAIYGKTPLGADRLAIFNPGELNRIQQFTGKQINKKYFRDLLKDSI
jgi:lysophospholipase L1-like esterase